MTRVWPWPQYRPRPALRRAVLLPALLAALGVLAAAKIALLAHNGVAILAGPAASARGPGAAGRLGRAGQSR